MTSNRIIKDALYEQVARIGKAVASPKRLELLELLCQAPKTVETLSQEAGISVKLVSAHLKELKASRLVDNVRQGKYMIYRIANDDVARFWVTIRLLAEDRLFELQSAVQQLSANSHEWITSDRQELLRKAQSGEIIVIDVRPEVEYLAGHLPFARSIPLGELSERLTELPNDRLIVAYCRGPFCFMSSDAVTFLKSQGLQVSQLRDGVAEWNSTNTVISS